MEQDQAAAFFRVLYTTRALRRLKPDPVPEELLFQLVDAAIRAPSGQNAQDWRFVVVTDPAIKSLMQTAATEAWARYQPRFAAEPSLMDELPRTKRLSLKATAHLAHHVGEAPAVILVCGLKARHSSPGGSAFPSVQNLLLAARAAGLGAALVTMPLWSTFLARRALGLPWNVSPCAVVPLGWPIGRYGPTTRRPVGDVVHVDRYGNRPWRKS